jgi:hypothetical protein
MRPFDVPPDALPRQGLRGAASIRDRCARARIPSESPDDDAPPRNLRQRDHVRPGHMSTADPRRVVEDSCAPVEQTNFPPDARSVREMLRARIAACQAVVHVAGVTFGAEPMEPAPKELPTGATPRTEDRRRATLPPCRGDRRGARRCFARRTPRGGHLPPQGRSRTERSRSPLQGQQGKGSYPSMADPGSRRMTQKGAKTGRNLAQNRPQKLTKVDYRGSSR